MIDLLINNHDNEEFIFYRNDNDYYEDRYDDEDY